VWPGPFSFDLLVFVHARCCGGFRLSSGSPLELQYQLLVKSDQASSGWVSAYRTLAVCTRFRFFSHDAGAHIHDRDDDFGSVRCGYRWWLVCSAVLSRECSFNINADVALNSNLLRIPPGNTGRLMQSAAVHPFPLTGILLKFSLNILIIIIRGKAMYCDTPTRC